MLMMWETCVYVIEAFRIQKSSDVYFAKKMNLWQSMFGLFPEEENSTH